MTQFGLVDRCPVCGHEFGGLESYVKLPNNLHPTFRFCDGGNCIDNFMKLQRMAAEIKQQEEMDAEHGK
jgi:hypothetical protein